MKLIPASHFTITSWYYFLWLQTSQRWKVNQDPEHNWCICGAGFNSLACAMSSLLAGLSPVSFAKPSSSPVELLCPVCAVPCTLLLGLTHPGTKMHQKGLCLPFPNPAACHSTWQLRPCPDSWSMCFQLCENHPEATVVFSLKATTSVSIQTHRSLGCSASTKQKNISSALCCSLLGKTFF